MSEAHGLDTMLVMVCREASPRAVAAAAIALEADKTVPRANWNGALVGQRKGWLLGIDCALAPEAPGLIREGEDTALYKEW
jgi:hypothetical protein